MPSQKLEVSQYQGFLPSAWIDVPRCVHALVRVLRELKSSGLIRTERGAFHLLDRDRLEQLGQFDPTYLHASPSV